MKFVIFVLTFCLFFASSLHATLAPSIYTYHGRIVMPNSLPLESNNVVFTMQVLSPGSESCILYEETHTKNMTGTGGIFSLDLGSGAVAVTDPGIGALTAMSNSILFNTSTYPGLSCGSGVSYSPSSGDGRNVRISFNYTGSGGPVVVSPDLMIGSAPYANYASRLEGKGKDEFLQTNTSSGFLLNQTNIEAVFNSTNQPLLMDAIDGTHSAYAKTSDLPITGGVLDLSGGGVLVQDAPASGGSAVNRNYTDVNLGGEDLDISGVGPGAGDGFVISWDQANERWTTVAAAPDITKLPLAGGTMTGAINMDGNNVLATGHITMSPQTTINLGTYTNAEETVLVGTLGPVDEGKIWYNSTTDVTKYWDGGTAGVFGGTDTTKLPLAGGTMTGAINMDGNNVLATGHITMSPQTTINLGTYTNAQETALVGTLGGVDAGKSWFNSTSNELKVWNGTTANSAVGVSIGDTAGTAMGADAVPNCTSSQKLTMSLGPTFLWSCTTELGDMEAVNTATGSGLSGGATSGNANLQVVVDDSTVEIATNTIQVKDGGITSAKIFDGTIATADIANTAVTDAKINDLGVDKITSGVGKYFTYLPNNAACTNGQILSWDNTNSRWECAADVGVSDHGALTGLLDDDHTQYAFLAGRSGGQSLSGGTDANDNLVLESTSNATKGDIILNPSTGNVGVGESSPDTRLDVAGTLKIEDGGETCTVAADAGMIKYDTGSLYICNGIAWIELAASAGTGDITAVNTATGSGLSGGATAGNANLQIVVDDSSIEIATNTIQVKDGGITSAKIFDGTIATADIADTAVTDAKINDLGVDKITSGVGKYFTYLPNNSACTNGQILSWDNTNSRWECATDVGVTDHGALTGLLDDDHTQYAFLAGRSGGQSLTGGTDANDNLVLESTSNATKGDIILNPSTGNVGVGESSPDTRLDVAGTLKIEDGGETCTVAADAGMIKYDTGSLYICNGIAWIELAASAGTGDITAVNTATGSGLSGGATAGNANLQIVVDDSSIEIATNTIQVKDGGITSAKIFDGTIATADIADTAVTDAKINDLGVDKITSGVGKYFTYLPNNSACTNGQILSWDNTNSRWECATDVGVTDHGALTGLLDDDHTQYAFLAGRSGGQSLTGGTDANDNLVLESTSNATKGDIILNPSTGNVGVGESSPDTRLDVAGTLKIEDGGETCTVAADAGMIKYDTGSLYICNGIAWIELAASAGTGDITAVNTATGSGLSGGATAGNANLQIVVDDSSIEIATNTIQVKDGGITSAKIFDGTIATADIADTAVTDAKINDLGVDKITSGVGKYFTYLPNNAACTDGQILSWDNTNSRWECAADVGVTDHGALTGLLDDDHTQYAFLAGRSGGQSLTGGIDANDNLVLESTSNATKGDIILNPSTGNVGVGESSPDTRLDVAGTLKIEDGGETCTVAADAGMIKYDTGSLYICNGIAWIELAASAGTGDITAVNTATGSGLSGGATAGNANLQIVVDDSSIEIATNTIQVKDGGITSAKIFDGTIATADIADTAVTDAKINDLGVDKITSGVGKYFTYLPNNSACTNGQILSWDNTNSRWECAADVGVTDHGALTGLLDDDHTQYAFLAGRSGGQSLSGGTDANDNLVLESTSSATKGDIILNPSTGNVGIGNSSPGSRLQVTSNSASSPIISENINDDNLNRAGLVLRRSRASASVPAADFGTNITFQLEGFTNDSNVNAARISSAWAGSQSNDTTDRDSYISFSTMEDNTIAEQVRIDPSGNVGVGEASPDTKLDVAGSVKIGDGGETCAVIYAGAMRYNSATIQFCNGTSWLTISSTGAGDNLGNHGATTTLNMNNNFLSGDGDAEGLRVGADGAINLAGAGTGVGDIITPGWNVVDDILRVLQVGNSTLDNGSVLFNNTGVVLNRNVADANPALVIEQAHASATGHILELKNSSSTVLVVEQGGDIGLGVADPVTHLDVGGTLKLGNGAEPCNSTYAGSMRYFGTNMQFCNGTTWLSIADTTGVISELNDLSDTKTDYVRNSVYLGQGSGTATTTGAQNNVAVGESSLPTTTTGDRNIAVGYFSLNNAGVDLGDNIAIGDNSLFNTSGGSNVAIGTQALYDNSGGAGSESVAVGYQSGFQAGGSNNVFVGRNAGANASGSSGSNNVFIGSQTGDNLTTGSNNITIGQGVDVVSATADNQLNIGNTIYGNLSNDRVGVGVIAPDTSLHIAGTLMIGDGSETCAATYAGAMRYNSATIQFCNGTSWLTMSSTGAGDNLGNHTATTNIQLGSNYLSGDGGNEGIYVDADGEVGIGTAAPGYDLQINGPSGGSGFGGADNTGGLRVAGATDNYGLSFQVWDGVTPRWGIIKHTVGSTTTLIEGTHASDDVIFNGGGNVGIGTTSPKTNMHIRGATEDIDSVTASGLNLDSDWNNNALFKVDQAGASGNALAISVSGTNNERKAYIQSGHTSGTESDELGTLNLNPFGGNVGIGTASPSDLMELDGSSTNGLTIQGEGDRTLKFIGNIESHPVISGVGSARIIGPANRSVAIEINGNGPTDRFTIIGDPSNGGVADTELFSVLNDGKVGVGTTNPIANGLDISNGHVSLIVGADQLLSTRTDNTVKFARVGVPHYSNGEEPLGLVTASSTATDNNIYIGGATSAFNTATNIQFFTAANTTTTTGSSQMTIDGNGDVGIGTTAPDAKLTVNGAIINDGAIEDNAGAIDFISGNIQYTTNSCATYNLHNLKSGGSYTFGVQGATSATCIFNAYSDAGTTALTVHMPVDHGATTASKHTIYSIVVMGTHAYFAWVKGL